VPIFASYLVLDYSVLYIVIFEQELILPAEPREGSAGRTQGRDPFYHKIIKRKNGKV
jgi:hypothetical protein